MSKYDELVQTILHSADGYESGGTTHRFVTLDFTKESHFQCVMELYGGEEYVRAELPNLYQRCMNAKMNKYPQDLYEGDTVGEDGIVDHAVICDLFADSNQALHSFGVSSLKDAASQVYSVMNLYNNNRLVGRDFSFEFNCHRAQVECSSEAISNLSGEISSVLHVTWTPADSDKLHSIILDVELLEVVEDPVLKATISHPVKTNYQKLTPVPLNIPNPGTVVVREGKQGPKQLEYINICYDRDPENNESINYSYGSTRIGLLQQRIFLDIRGSFQLMPGCTYKNINHIAIGLQLGSGGTAIYKSLIDYDVNFTVNNEKNEITFQLPTDWSTDIPSKKLAGRTLSNLDFHLEFSYYDSRDNANADPKERIALITASSTTSKSFGFLKSDHFIPLDQVKLNWGCVEEHTLVHMADGSTQEICTIHPGDRVLTPDGGNARVVNVIRGTEEELYAIQAVNGQILLASAEHPIRTSTGFKSAMDISPVDCLQMADGSSGSISALYNVQGEFCVYNLELDDSHVMICNGYQVGDNDMQGMLMSDAEQIAQPDAALLAEAHKLAKFFS